MFARFLPSKTSASARFRGWLFVFQQQHPPPSKTSTFARFRGWLLVYHHYYPRKRAYLLVFVRGWLLVYHHHPTTLETEQTCSFSRVMTSLPTPSKPSAY